MDILLVINTIKYGINNKTNCFEVIGNSYIDILYFFGLVKK